MPEKNKIPRFRELFHPIRRSWALSLAGCVTVIVTVAAITVYTPRVYRASATLLVKQGNDTQGQLFEISNVILQKYLIKNQVAIIESRSLAEAVIRKLEASAQRDSLELLGFVPKNANRGF